MTETSSNPAFKLTVYEPDVTGEEICIGDVSALLAEAPYALRRLEILAEKTIRQPDEIWSEWSNIPLSGIETQFRPAGPITIRRYIARFRIEGQLICVTALTEIDSVGWRVREVLDGEAAVNAARTGVLCYRRG